MSDKPIQPSEPHSTRAQEDELFGLLLRRIPNSVDRHQLEEATVAALQLMLRRTGDKALTDALRGQIGEIVHGLGETAEDEASRTRLRAAADRCVERLEHGKAVRPPRTTLIDPAHRGGGHPHHPAAAKPRNQRKRVLGFAALAILLGCGIGLYGLGGGHSHTAADLARQMEAAAQGQAAPMHAFGGILRATRDGRNISVVAERVPPDICVSTSWALIRKGVIDINGTTPQRVTASQLSELCHEHEEGATVTWSPQASEPSPPQ